MLEHRDIGGRCSGKLIRQSRGKKTSEAKYICNVCDFTIDEPSAHRQARRKKLHQMRKRHAAPE